MNIRRYIASFTVLCVMTAAFGTISYANDVQRSDFIKNEYTVKTAGNLNSGISVDDPLPGKTEIGFNFTAPQEGTITLSAQNIINNASVNDFLEINFTSEKVSTQNSLNEAFDVYGSLESGNDYSLIVKVDLDSNVYDVVLYKNKEKTALVNYRENIPLGMSGGVFGLTGISANGAVDVGDIEIKRERKSYDTVDVDFHKSYVRIGTTLKGINPGEEYSIIAAAYDKDTTALTSVKVKEFVCEGDYLETYFTTDGFEPGEYLFSVFAFKKDNIMPLATNRKMTIENAISKPESPLVFTGFEDKEEFDTKSNVTAGKLPKGWTANAWAVNNEKAEAPYNIEFTAGGDYGSYAALGAVDKGYVGIISPMTTLPETGIKMSFDTSCSSGYEGNFPRMFILYYNSSGAFVNSGSFTKIEGVSADKWTSSEIFVSPENYPDGAVKFAAVLSTSKDSETASGEVYYDNVVISDNVFRMQCQDNISWYNSGETVCYTPKYAISDTIDKIFGDVYDSYGEHIDTVECDAQTVKTDGWRYTPQKSGLFSVVFRAQTKQRRVLFENGSYKAYYNDANKTEYYLERNRHDFYVSAFESQSFDDRNPLFGLSMGNGDGTEAVDIADSVGMSYIRLHAFSWKDIEKEQGEYDWTVYDTIFDSITDGDRDFGVIGNILYTPQWASPEQDDTVSVMVPKYASYAPEKLEYLESFIDELYAKYGEHIDTWEIYNEPHLPGGSVFWNDTTENYVNMLASTYNKLKALSGADAAKSTPDTVVMGGIGAKRYLPFYRQFLEKGGWQYTDKLTMHGYDVDPWNYLNINNLLGIEGEKGVVNTESHTILLNKSSDDYYLTEKEVALRLVKDTLRQLKYGIEKITYFSAYDSSLAGEDIYKLDGIDESWSRNVSGLFRSNPNFEPRFAAGVLNTLISMCGENAVYNDEYRFGGNVNAVYLMADGSPLLAIWADELQKASADAALSDILAGAQIRDWEGNLVSSESFEMAADTMYFVSGFDADKLAELASVKGDKLYDGEVLYSENEASKQVGSDLTANQTIGAIFDHETGAVSSGVTWNSFSDGSDSKFAFTFCDDGFDIAVKVKDSTKYFAGKKESDSVIIGFDTFANGIAKDVVEMTAYADSSGSGTVIKTAAPSFGGDLPNCVGEGGTVNGKCYAKNDGAYTYYSIHIPTTELYPYFPVDDSDIRFGLNYSDYNTSGKKTANRYWSAGGFYTKYYPWNFGKAHIKLNSEYTDVIEMSVTAQPYESVTVEISDGSGELVYLNQYECDETGSCTIKAPLDDEGTYTLRTCADSIGYNTLGITYKKTN